MKRPIYYSQRDPRWAKWPYSNKDEKTDIAGSGCGPTCMAMAIATWVDKKITPLDACKWSLAHGFKATKQGTYYVYFKAHGAVYKLEVKQVNNANLRNTSIYNSQKYHDEALRAIKDGHLVIACMGPGNWTRGGHFILWYDYDGEYVYINDPNSEKPTRSKNTLKLLQSEVKYYFILYRPDTVGKEEVNMAEKRYQHLEDIPSWFRPEVEALINCGALTGSELDGNKSNGNELNLSEDMLRTIIVCKRYIDQQNG